MSWPPLKSTIALRGQRILVVDDSYLVAEALAELLESEGAEVIGPAATVDEARRLTIETAAIDAAILDVTLRGQTIWPVADLLFHRGVRLVFATGFAAADIRKRYKGIHVIEKPAPARMVVRVMSMDPPQTPGG